VAEGSLAATLPQAFRVTRRASDATAAQTLFCVFMVLSFDHFDR
jgi:hypothetical protein